MTDSARRTWISVLVAVGSVIGGVISSFTFNVTVPTIPQSTLTRLEFLEDLIGRYRLEQRELLEGQEATILKRVLQEDYESRQEVHTWVESFLEKRGTSPDVEARLRILEHQSGECTQDAEAFERKALDLAKRLEIIERRVHFLEKEVFGPYNDGNRFKGPKPRGKEADVSHGTIINVAGGK